MPEPGRVGPSLVYQLEGSPRVFPIPEGATTLGSARDNDLVLDHGSVSAHHVVIMRAADEVELRDLFAGDTRVNGVVRRSGPLEAGDLLALGEVRLRVLRVELPEQGEADPERGSTTTGRFERFSPDEVDEAQLERSLFPGDEATPEQTGTARFDAAALKAAPARAAAPPGQTPVEPMRDTRRILRQREARRARALARARQLSDDISGEADFERLLEKLAVSFLELFGADRAVAVLFEEDGKNPLLTVERCRDGSITGAGIAPEIVERCLQARTVVRVAGSQQQALDGLAAPLFAGERALGLLYFERLSGDGDPLELEDVHLMAILANQAALVIAPLLAPS